MSSGFISTTFPSCWLNPKNGPPSLLQVTSSLERKKTPAPSTPAAAAATSTDFEDMDPQQLKAALKSVTLERDTLQGVYEDLRSQFDHLRIENDKLAALQSTDSDGDPTTPQLDQPDVADRRRSRIASVSGGAAAAEPEEEEDNEELERRYRAEVDRLQSELHATADKLAEAEASAAAVAQEAEQSKLQADECRAKAEEADRLKDEVDELRHAADRLVKSDAVIEKYKKKLEEAADVRRNLKARCVVVASCSRTARGSNG